MPAIAAPRTSALILTLFLLLIVPLLTVALPTGNNSLPTKEAIQNRLNILAKQHQLTSTEQALQQDLLQTLALLGEIDQIRQNEATLKQQISQAPIQVNKINSDLDALKTPLPGKEQLAKLSLSQLEQRLNNAVDGVQNAQSNLSAYSSQLINLQTQPEQIQNSMLTATKAAQEVRNQLNSATANLTAERKQQQTTLLYSIDAKLDYQRHQLAANTTLQDLLQKQRDYTTTYINRKEELILLLQEVLNSKRLNQSKKSIRATQDNAESTANHPLLEQVITANKFISQRLLQATQISNTLTQQNNRTQNWLDQMQQAERNLKEQIAILKGSLLLSRILYQQQAILPDSLTTSDLTNRIADLRLEQFEINQQRDALFQGKSALEQLGLKDEGPVNSTLKQQLEVLVEVRRNLLDRLNWQLGEELRLSINLQINQQQLLQLNDAMQDTLKQQIFWISSNKQIDIKWITSFPGAVAAELKDINSALSGKSLKRQNLLYYSWIILPLLILLVLHYTLNKKITPVLARISKQIGLLHLDSQWHTPIAILLVVAQSIAIPLSILLLGWYCTQIMSANSTFWLLASQRLALSYFVLLLIHNMLAENGISQIHFQIDNSERIYYRQRFSGLFILILPLIFWSVVGECYPLILMGDVIGQSVILLTLLLLAILLFPLCKKAWRKRHLQPVHLVITAAISLMPLLLIGLMLTGYFYTTLKLARHWIDSLYLLLMWNITFYTAVRGLSVAARRLAYRRALARRKNMSKDEIEGVKAEQEPLGLKQINQQTLRLTTMALFILFMLMLYAIWSDIAVVFTYLDNIILWHYQGTPSGSNILQAVTLGNLLFAILLAVITYIMTHNLPGLLEVLILSRLQLRQGTAYAFNTILNYLITAMGIVAILAILGVSWNKLQWLVAALSVGLGFGLQEIFANFISGLIILFERPIRIGDVITIGTFTGTVGQIHIRATTITDFDHKEVIVPNKAFVTERLINWTLSDTVTRVQIKLGVDYDSDLNLFRELLLQAAQENSRVMKQPEPQVFFIQFSASTLDHELWIYVGELKDRNYAIDEIQRRIVQLCRKNKINIAFNQLDVHLYQGEGTKKRE